MLFLIFKELPHCFPTAAAAFTLWFSIQGSTFSTFSPVLTFWFYLSVRFFVVVMEAILLGCEVASLYGVDLCVSLLIGVH